MRTTTDTNPRPMKRRTPEERRAIEEIGEEIADLASRIDTVTHRLLTRLREFVDEGGWEAQGAKTPAHWLSWRTGMDLGAARERVRVARALGGLPLIDEALRQGRVSFAKVRAMTRVATPATEELLLQHAEVTTAGRLERICRGMRYALAMEDPEAEPERYVRHWTTESGMVRIQIQLPAEEGAILLKAVEAARTEQPPVEDRAASRAEGLLVIAERYLDEKAQQSPASPRFEVTVVVDQDALEGRGPGAAMLDDDLAVPQETARRIGCDAPKVELLVDSAGNALDVGRRSRTIPPAMRRALAFRDRGCRFPSCTNRLFVDGHHIHHWSQGGETRLDNLVMLCRRHHRAVHEGGFQVAMVEGRPIFHDPVGRLLPEQPPRDVSAETSEEFEGWLDYVVPPGPLLDPYDLPFTVGGLVDRELGVVGPRDPGGGPRDG